MKGSFTVRPDTGFAAGNHSAVLTVSAGEGVMAECSLSFTVEEAV